MIQLKKKFFYSVQVRKMANDVNIGGFGIENDWCWKNNVVLGDFNLFSEMKRFSSIMRS